MKTDTLGMPTGISIGLSGLVHVVQPHWFDKTLAMIKDDFDLAKEDSTLTIRKLMS